MTLHVNNIPVFQGTEEQCMDYALEHYNLIDEPYGELKYDGSTLYRGNVLEILEGEE